LEDVQALHALEYPAYELIFGTVMDSRNRLAPSGYAARYLLFVVDWNNRNQINWHVLSAQCLPNRRTERKCSIDNYANAIGQSLVSPGEPNFANQAACSLKPVK
jgi:hypothetical protein